MASSKLQIVLQAVDKTGQAFKSANEKFKKMNKMSAETAKNLKRIGVVGAGLGIAIGKKAVDAAVSFEKAMANVSTIVDTNVESMENMKKEILDMSTRAPVAIDELTSALYDVRSAGIAADGAMATLEASAKLATAGLGTTKEAANILTSAINSFGLNAKKSEEHADVFFKAVKSGKTTVAGLSQGFGQIAPMANAMGVQFEELMAITSAMTTSGMKASIAYSQIRAALSNLAKPTKEMKELMEKLNIENMQSEIRNNGLQATLIKLAEATDGNNEMLAKAFGSVEALNAVMMLLSGTGEMATEIFDDMTTGENELDSAFKKVSESTEKQFQLMKNDLNVVMIELGNRIIPLVIKAVEGLTWVFDEWAEHIRATKKELILFSNWFKTAAKSWKDLPANLGMMWIPNMEKELEGLTRKVVDLRHLPITSARSRLSIDDFIAGMKTSVDNVTKLKKEIDKIPPGLDKVGSSSETAIEKLRKSAEDAVDSLARIQQQEKENTIEFIKSETKRKQSLKERLSDMVVSAEKQRMIINQEISDLQKKNKLTDEEKTKLSELFEEIKKVAKEVQIGTGALGAGVVGGLAPETLALAGRGSIERLVSGFRAEQAEATVAQGARQEGLVRERGTLGATFNFDFSNADISDEDKLVQRIIESVNRAQSLTTQGAM